jgi:peptide/nickel transport system permease protein
VTTLTTDNAGPVVSRGFATVVRDAGFARNPWVGIVARRAAFAIPLLFFVSVVTFVLIAISPGDAAHILAGPDATASQFAVIRRQLGLDDPITAQYWHWLQHLVLHGSLGSSIVNGLPVTQLIAQRIGVTMSLVLFSTLLAAVAGVALGSISAARGGRVGRVVDVVAVASFAVPNYWLGLLFIAFLSIKLHWFPAVGFVSFGTSPVQWLHSLVLPVLTLSLGGIAGIAKQTRDAMLVTLSKPFIAAHRADKMPERTIIFRHALRNSAAPILAMVGLFFVGSLSGTILIEQVFGLPGMGSLAVSASTEHDIPVIQGVALCFAAMVVIVNLLLDLLFRALNPKVEVV